MQHLCRICVVVINSWIPTFYFLWNSNVQKCYLMTVQDYYGQVVVGSSSATAAPEAVRLVSSNVSSVLECPRTLFAFVMYWVELGSTCQLAGKSLMQGCWTMQWSCRKEFLCILYTYGYATNEGVGLLSWHNQHSICSCWPSLVVVDSTRWIQNTRVESKRVMATHC